MSVSFLIGTTEDADAGITQVGWLFSGRRAAGSHAVEGRRRELQPHLREGCVAGALCVNPASARSGEGAAALAHAQFWLGGAGDDFIPTWDKAFPRERRPGPAGWSRLHSIHFAVSLVLTWTRH